MGKAESLQYGPQGKRLLGGLLANGFNVLARIGVQFLIIPILFVSWDPTLVGIWLLLSSIPSYLGLTAGGFGAAGGNLTISSEKAGEPGMARAALRATWLLVTGSNVLIVAAFAATSDWIVVTDVFHTSSVPADQLRSAILWQCAYVLLSVQGAVLALPFRHGGQYPRSIFLASLQSTVEVLATAIVVTQTDRLDILSMSLSGVRLVFLLLTGIYAFRASPGLFRKPPPGTVRQALAAIWRPSLAFMAAPVVFGLNLQGYNLLVGAFFGPVALASFVATRIFVRALDIVTNFAYSIQFYELPYLHGEGDDLMKRLVATMTWVMLAISIVFLACIAFLGEPVLRIWTVGKAEFDLPVALGLGVAGVIRAVSISPAATLSAINRNSTFIAYYVLSSAVSFAIALGMGKLGAPLWAMVLTLLVAELGQAIPAFANTARELSYPLREMLSDILHVRRRWADLKNLRRELMP